ncbi:hypothetical protein PIB30_029157 [Stylosanthes scabra]|uniref:Replication factor A C-terminal domain-containing protein n=1 Tax=Stylosanthes scabra TaxID=79078 RepID=A0ABU6Y8C6_9FABA|nr:hypothetical protein [Stylosanthes scabra]
MGIIFIHTLLRDDVVASQRVKHVESQPQHSATDELSGGEHRISTIEDVLNVTEETHLWVLGEVVSVEVGLDDWCYPSRPTCKKKVYEKKSRLFCKVCSKFVTKSPLRYRLNIIIREGLDPVYSVYNISDNEKLIGVYSSQGAFASQVIMDDSVSGMLPSADVDSALISSGVVSLSKDFTTESNFEDSQTPDKTVGGESVPNPVTSLCNPENQLSTNRTLRRGNAKRKFE